MVNDNDSTENRPATAPKRRLGLFGRRAAEASKNDATSAEQDIETTTAPEPDPVPESAVEDASVDEAPVEETPAAPRRRTRAKSAADHVSASPGVIEEQVAVAEGDTADTSSSDAPAEEPVRSTTALLFQAPDLPTRPEPAEGEEGGTVRRRSRRRSGESERAGDDAPGTVVRVRQPRPAPEPITEPQRVKGSTRLEAKKQRRRDGRDAGRRRPVVTESEFLARRESVDRQMIVRSKHGRIQIAVLEDSVLVEHYVAKAQEASLIGNVYLGRVQNVLPSMEAAFVDIGRGRNAVLYSGEVDWDAAAAEGDGKNQARRIELALKPGDRVLVQVTKDPVGHKGARLTSQVSLPGRYLVYVPNGSMSGISRKLPDTERSRLKKILKEVLPDNVGVIVRTAAEGATEEQLTLDVNRLTTQWAEISRLVETQQAPALLHSEPDLLIKIIRDVFNEDFQKLIIEGEDARQTIESYLRSVAPDLLDRLSAYDGTDDSFDRFRVTEQIEKALDRKVWLPSGGSLVIDRTEAMTVVDVNTGKFVGSGGNLEETVTKNNLEAAEEIVRQLRLRDIGGIIVVDFIDMVLESNRDLVLRRLVECLSRDRTKHQVAEVTSLGLVQMTRKKLGLGLLETFSEQCDVCAGRGIIVHHDPVTKHRQQTQSPQPEQGGGRRRGRGGNGGASVPTVKNGVGGVGTHAITEDVRNALARVASVTVHHDENGAPAPDQIDGQLTTTQAETSVEGGDTGNAPATDAPTDAPKTKRRTPRKSKASAAKSSEKNAGTDAAPAGSSGEADGQSDIVETVAILDIPVAKRARAPRTTPAPEAQQLLETVLDSLPPASSQPSSSRPRVSRRAGSAGQVVSAPPAED
ncbi:ribonuclease E [Microbacteriaceae bacterium SG_E_30_P1]|uniref:Ribonuclease E n=1 Tax=Antiquaquibacter oligotrophicus TaxID=2880260 RepID=A0ABT6KP37_9MICO|nr:Rne/Rng family ribonuclease [Antiquaquibacter oligotrophicus]MDH6181223.1 ribonuclease E [Antiquaquibacter oligotrophicus]UDF13082.1 Rne/Rng family ribonuclease [Antiquaquibacter oligotrophicus]